MALCGSKTRPPLAAVVDHIPEIVSRGLLNKIPNLIARQIGRRGVEAVREVISTERPDMGIMSSFCQLDIT